MVLGGERTMKSADYYKLWFEETGGAVCRKADLKGVSEYFIYQPEPIEEWPEEIAFYAEGEPLEDYLFPTMVDWVLISERVKQVLEKLEVKGVQFLPIRVVRKETGEEVPGYWVLHVWKQISALDEEHTVYFEPRDEKYPQLDIIKVALRKEAIGKAEIFRLKERKVSIYVSRRVKERLEEMGATGFKWIPVPSY
jgi:hypothetical protein